MAGHRARRPFQWRIAAGAGAGVVALAMVAWLAFGGGGRPAPRGAAGPPAAPTSAPAPADTGVPAALASAPSLPASASPSPSRGRTATPAPSAPSQGQTQRFYVTLYGARDNTPPGSREIAYPTVHREAGGTGTYADPVTFATSRVELPVGTLIYYPYLKRYFVMEDDCVDCDREWAERGFRHIDLWAGASTNAGIIDCEEALTQNGQVPVIVRPAPGLPVDTTPLYDGTHCYRPR
jgi:hypothetical protein